MSGLLPEEVTHRDVNTTVFGGEREGFQTLKCDLTVVKMTIVMSMDWERLKAFHQGKKTQWIWWPNGI